MKEFFKDQIRFLFGLNDNENVSDIALYSTFGVLIFFFVIFLRLRLLRI